VADAGPLLHLFWLGAADWALPPEPLHVVSEVWEEVAAHAPGILQDQRIVRVEAPPTSPALFENWRLDAGERAALSYAVSLPAGEALFLCDEREARHACAAAGLAVVGSVGLIVAARHAGRVTRRDCVEALLDLPTRGRLHIRADLIRAALDALGD
jgi:predicted nucleic acid-binding protein